MQTPKPIILKKCSKCGGTWDEEAFFRKNSEHRRSGQVYLATHAVCIGCELTERNDPTPEERARRKAQNTIATHAEKRDMLPSEFAKRYGWDVERMVYDVIHGHKNTCTYCWEKYERMGHGLSDMTLDVIDRGREPYYRTNTKWCCATCNREKATLTPELWDRRLIVWPQYMKWREGVIANPTHGLPLFADQVLLTFTALAIGVGIGFLAPLL
jgi:hypothetical protein